MSSKTGPKLTAEHREYLIELLIAGKSVEQILLAFERRGYPQITRQAIHHYRKDKRVTDGRDQRLAAIRESGMACRTNRIARIEHRLSQYNHRLNGTHPDPYDPEEATIGPPCVVSPDDFRRLSAIELRYLQEVERLCYPQKAGAIMRDEAGNVIGSVETESGPTPLDHGSEISMQAMYNDMLQRVLERTRGKTLEELRAERLAASENPPKAIEE